MGSISLGFSITVMVVGFPKDVEQAGELYGSYYMYEVGLECYIIDLAIYLGIGISMGHDQTDMNKFY